LGVSASLPTLLHAAGERFAALIAAQPGIAPEKPPQMPPHAPELRWHNAIFSGTHLRRAHVERFEIEHHFSVLHVCIFPHIDDPSPIFGFDMIGGRAQATGAFLDFSPATLAPPAPSLTEAISATALASFTQKREKPAWGGIFSDDFLAIRPACMQEAEAAIGIAETALIYYLGRVASDPPVRTQDGAPAIGQAAYVRAQRQNPHTARMLARYTNEQAARHFIETVLFPLP